MLEPPPAARRRRRISSPIWFAAAHELKTSLTAIKGHGQLLRRQARAGTLDPARLDAGLAGIDAAAIVLAAALDALIAEVEASPLEPDPDRPPA